MSARTARTLERGALVGMAVGVAFMLQPAWSGGMRTGFFVVIATTLAQIVLGKLAAERP
ncbi:MAG: hypothetical protein JNK02_04440 [Planctomycetes bacterium]|nr:hypothetical protein [Planctomycetota bacterium]